MTLLKSIECCMGFLTAKWPPWHLPFPCLGDILKIYLSFMHEQYEGKEMLK